MKKETTVKMVNYNGKMITRLTVGEYNLLIKLIQEVTDESCYRELLEEQNNTRIYDDFLSLIEVDQYKPDLEVATNYLNEDDYEILVQLNKKLKNVTETEVVDMLDAIYNAMYTFAFMFRVE